MILCMAAATVFFGVFAYLYLTAGEELSETLTASCMEIQQETIRETQIEMLGLAAQLQKDSQFIDRKKIKQGQKLKKKQDEAKKQLELLNMGKLNVLDTVPLAGYRLIQVLTWDATNDLVKKLNQKCMQFKEKKEAIHYTYYLLATLIGNIILGMAGLFAGIAIGLAMNMGMRSFLIGIVIFVIFGLLGYIPYDSVNAYSKFISRCSNTYTTKLATAIIQNISKGNSEIVTLFRQLNDESWLEHKHNARRMGEKIQSKLLLPTMLMFGGIIILIIVPVMSGFNF